MIEYLENAFNIPPIFIVLCYALGTAVVIGIGHWTRIIALGRYQKQNLWNIVGAWMLRAFVSIILFSFSVQIGYWSAYIGQPDKPSYMAELCILASVSLLYIYSVLRKEYFQEVTLKYCKEIGLVCLYLAVSCILWLASIFVFLFAQIAIASLPSMFAGIFDPVRDAVIILVSLWLMPFIYWFNKGKDLQEKEPSKTPEHYKFHHVLWPFIVAIFFFILPLFVEKVASSGKIEEMMNAKPPLERI